MRIKPRILIGGLFYGRGGKETHMQYLAELLVGAGCEVTVASRYASPEAPLVAEHRQRGVQFVATPFARNRRWFKLSTAWARLVWPKMLRPHSFDTVYTLEDSQLTVFLRRFVRDGGHVVYNRAGEPLPPNEGPRENLQGVDLVVVESELQAEAWRRNSGVSAPVVVAPHLTHEAGEVDLTRPPGTPLCVAYLGRYERNKGIYRLLDIWDQCRDQALRLDFFGLGSERQGLIDEIRRRDLSRIVDIHDGWNMGSEMDAILSKCDLVVLPSETEGLPGILVESMARGVPFVASDVGAVRTLAEDNPDVKVVPLDTEALRRGILEMANAIQAGKIQRARLRNYHTARFGRRALGEKWLSIILSPGQAAAATTNRQRLTQGAASLNNV